MLEPAIPTPPSPVARQRRYLPGRGGLRDARPTVGRPSTLSGVNDGSSGVNDGSRPARVEDVHEVAGDAGEILEGRRRPRSHRPAEAPTDEQSARTPSFGQSVRMELTEAVDAGHRALEAFVRGDPAPFQALFSDAGSVS